MGSLLHNLDRDSILMLYLADELSPEDRAEVELMLQADLVLQGELSRLAEAQQLVVGALNHADQSRSLPISESSLLRRVTTVMNQRQVEQLAHRPSAAADVGRRQAWIWSSAAVAALILISIGLFWNRSDDTQRNVAVGPDVSINATDVDEGAADDSSTWARIDDLDVPDAEDEVATGLEPDEIAMPTLYTEADRKLSSTERELATLRILASSLREDR